MTDEERFAQSVPPLALAMLRAASALLGPVDGEDATQEAITRAWQARSALRDQAALRPGRDASRAERLSPVAPRPLRHAPTPHPAAAGGR